jgi:hypothetical protein
LKLKDLEVAEWIEAARTRISTSPGRGRGIGREGSRERLEPRGLAELPDRQASMQKQRGDDTKTGCGVESTLSVIGGCRKAIVLYLLLDGKQLSLRGCETAFRASRRANWYNS